MPGAQDDGLEGHGRHANGDVGFAFDALGEAAQQAATTNEVHAALQEVLGHFGWHLRQATRHRLNDLRNHFVDGKAHFLGGEVDVLGQAGDEVATAHLSTTFVGHRRSGTDLDLDLFGGAFTDRDAVLASHVRLDRCVDVEASDTDGFERNDATEADDRRFAGASTDVDDHVADGFIDRQLGADRRGHGLLDQLGIGGTRATGRIGDCTTLDFGDGRRHADDDLGSGETRNTNPLQQETDHPLGDVEVGDGPTAQRTHGNDVTRRTADHVPGLVSGGQNLAGFAVDRNHGGLVQDDSTALHVDERVRRAEVDCKVAGHVRPV